MKKFLLSALSAVSATALAITGTIAYLTWEDEDVNVMTTGDVQIEQLEYERVVDEDGNPVLGVVGEDFTSNYGITQSYKLKEFTQGKPAYPAVYTNGDMGWDAFQQLWNGIGAPGSNDLFDDSMKNVIDKFVFVKNTGESDAYFRTIVAIECPEGLEDSDIHVSFNINDRYDYNDEIAGSQKIAEANAFYTMIDGVRYLVYTATHTEALKPGDISRPSLLQVYLDPAVTNEKCALFDGTWEILALSQAVQTVGFADADTALDTAFGDVNAATVAEWIGKKGNVQYIEAPGMAGQIEGEAAEEILADLTEGKNLFVDKNMDLLGFDTNDVDAKGATVTLNGVGAEAYGYLAFLPDAGEDVEVSNLNVTGSGFVEVGHYGMGGGNYTVNNLKIENLASTLKNDNKGFQLACAFMANGDAVLNNCEITGTTAVQEGAMPVDLACGQAWSGYKDDDDNKVSTTINGGKFGVVYCWEHARATFNGAKIDTLYVSPIGGTVTIQAGTVIDTIRVDYGSKPANATAANLAKLIIDDGATVNAIVYGGETYTVAEWNTYVNSL